MKEEINDELNILNSSLAGSKVGMPYNVPQGYFSDLAQNVLSNTEIGSSNSLPIYKDMPHQVPSSYFDGLAKEVTSKVAPKKEVRLLSFTTIRWAAAAMLLMMVGAAITVSLQRQNEGKNKAEVAFVVADRDIEAYFADNAKPEMTSLPDISDLTNTTEVEPKEIIYYLDQTGWDTEYYN